MNTKQNTPPNTIPSAPWWFWLSLGILLVLLQALLMDFSLNPYDEGLTLYGAVRVLHGQLPYRDFWTMYGPGQFVVFATLFKLTGIYALWGRLFYLFSNAVTLVAVFYLALLLTRAWRTAAFATLTALIAVAGIVDTSYTFPIYPALGLVMLATVALVHFWRLHDLKWIGAAGIAVGLTVLFRHDIALYAAVGLFLSNLYFRISPQSQPHRLKQLLRDGAWFAAGILLVALPATLYLILHISSHDLVYSLLYVPARIYPGVRTLPFTNPLLAPPLIWHRFLNPQVPMQHPEYVTNLVVYLPLVVLATATAFARTLRKRLATWEASTYVALILLVALMFLKGLVRLQALHMTQAFVPAILLFWCLLSQGRREGRLAKAILVGSSLCVLFLLYTPTVVSARRLKEDLHALTHKHDPHSFASTCKPPAGLEVARCLYVSPDQANAALYLQQHTTQQETIFVGAGRHDKLFANNISFYLLARRESATKWHDLHPGVETTQPIQAEMIGELNGHHAAYVVRDPFADNMNEPNGSNSSSGVYDLDHYIDSNYRLEARFGTLLILHRVTPF